VKLLSFEHSSGPRPGLLIDDTRVLDLIAADAVRPIGPDVSSMLAIIQGGDATLAALAKYAEVTPPANTLFALDALRLSAPIPRPLKNIFCVGRNYVEHVKEGALANKIEMKIPQAPQFFTKAPTTVIGHEATVRIATHVTERLDYEVELGVVIGKSGADIAPENAFDHIFGFTIVNDVTGRDLQRLHEQWFKGKSLDTSCPIGPVVVTRDALGDPRPLNLFCRVKGEERQHATIDMMIFDIPTLIASLSRGMTLEPGDIVATGTPSGVGFAMTPPMFLRHGDVVECEIEGIGVLRNTIATDG
jgi:2-keto-4-pentenoate hydratase/2-oxohepta-3-ene-1,7-dioic acid hydratase in catechol pathway